MQQPAAAWGCGPAALRARLCRPEHAGVHAQDQPGSTCTPLHGGREPVTAGQTLADPADGKERSRRRRNLRVGPLYGGDDRPCRSPDWSLSEGRPICVSTDDAGLDITEQLQVVDWLKAELVASVASVLRAALSRDSGRMLEALAGVQITLYALARRWGVSLTMLEQEVLRRIDQETVAGHYLESRFGDLTQIRQHLQRRSQRPHG